MLYFYLSYAKDDDQDTVRRFFEDLSAEVRVHAGLPPKENVGFYDVASIEIGVRWPVRLVDALTTCQTFVALCSPRYFRSEFCGREWTVFADRLARSPGQSRDGPLLPLRWLPIELPAVARKYQWVLPGPRALMDKAGVRQLMRLQRYRDDYLELLFSLASQIVQVARNQPVAEGRPVEFERVSNAFQVGMSAGTAAAPDPASVVMRAFDEAGMPLRPSGLPGFYHPAPVWVCEESEPTINALRQFASHAARGRLAYLIHTEELGHEAETYIDRLRMRGNPIALVAFRALRAAVTDGSSRAFLMEIERRSGTKDNLFDTKNALIDERFLFGRGALLNTIGSAIGRDEHVLITGLRKVGKTSMLNILRQHLVDNPVCMVDLQRFDRHHEDWPTTLFHLMLDAFDRWGSISHLDWPFEPSWPRTTTELERELERRQAYLDRQVRLVVILDEIERVFPHPTEEQAAWRWIKAAGSLRALAQGDRRSVTIIGADLRPVANRENNIGTFGTNPLFSFFKEIPLALLDPAALGEMVTTISEEMGLRDVEVSFIDRLYRLTGGHPSLARTLASESYLQRQVPSSLTVDDLELGLASLNDSDSMGYFLRNNIWQLMTRAERAVMARTPALLTPLERKQAEATLAAQGLVNDGRITIGLLEDWIPELTGRNADH